MLLNADLGEGFDDVDRKVMPFIDQANIACGGHAGSDHSIMRTVKLAAKHDVAIGAHPSYEDTRHFGRRSLDVDLPILEKQLSSQIQRVALACEQQGYPLNHIKAHGALYNDSQRDAAKMHLLLKLAKRFHCKLMVQSLANMSTTLHNANKLNVELIKEGFADRAYQPDGTLVARRYSGAVYDSVEKILQQGLTLAKQGNVRCIGGQTVLQLKIDSLCVHGDNTLAFQALTALYNDLHRTSK